MSETPPQTPADGPEQPDPTATPPEGSQTASAPEDPPSGAPEGEAGDELGRVRREAADRRVRLREVEAENERLRAQVAAYQRGEIERMAAERLADPADLFRHDGVEFEALLADDGNPDPERVAATVAEVVEAHPAWARPPVDFGAGVRRPVESAPSFGDALKQAARGVGS